MFIRELGLYLKNFNSVQVGDRFFTVYGTEVADNGQIEVTVLHKAKVKVETSTTEYAFDRAVDMTKIVLSVEDSIACYKNGKKTSAAAYVKYLQKVSNSAIADSKATLVISNLNKLLLTDKVAKLIAKMTPETEEVPDDVVIAMLLDDDLPILTAEGDDSFPTCSCECEEDVEDEDTEDEVVEIEGDAVEVINSEVETTEEESSNELTDNTAESIL